MIDFKTWCKIDLGIAFVLFVIFLILKLTKVIFWSWWWITSPLWIGIGIIIVFLLTILIILRFF